MFPLINGTGSQKSLLTYPYPQLRPLRPPALIDRSTEFKGKLYEIEVQNQKSLRTQITDAIWDLKKKNYFGLNYFEFKVARPLVRGPKVRWLDSDTLNCTIESKVKTFFAMRPSKCTITELLEVYAYLILEFAQSNKVPMQTKNGVIETFFKFAAQVDDTLQNQLVIARTIRTMAMNTDIIPTLIRCGAVKTLETYASSMYNSRQLDTIVAWGCLNLAFTSEGRFALNNNGFKNTLQKLYSRSVFEDAKEMIYNAQTRLNVPYGFNAVDLYAPYPLR